MFALNENHRSAAKDCFNRHCTIQQRFPWQTLLLVFIALLKIMLGISMNFKWQKKMTEMGRQDEKKVILIQCRGLFHIASHLRRRIDTLIRQLRETEGMWRPVHLAHVKNKSESRKTLDKLIDTMYLRWIFLHFIFYISTCDDVLFEFCFIKFLISLTLTRFESRQAHAKLNLLNEIRFSHFSAAEFKERIRQNSDEKLSNKPQKLVVAVFLHKLRNLKKWIVKQSFPQVFTISGKSEM